MTFLAKPVAWRVKDYADGWLVFHDEAIAYRFAKENGAVIQGLYVRDGGCKCGACGRQYKVDIIVPDEMWERIKPWGKPKGAGLLCGPCIMEHIELRNEFGALQLTAITSAKGDK